MLDRAIEIAGIAFAGKNDKGGVPYVLHCLHVMHQVKHLGEEAMIAAVLHDLIEDTNWTIGMLGVEGFTRHTISVIDLLTHRNNETYDAYINRISVSTTARAIKMADLRHNSDIHRMKGLKLKDFDRLAKYHKAYAFLRGITD